MGRVAPVLQTPWPDGMRRPHENMQNDLHSTQWDPEGRRLRNQKLLTAASFKMVIGGQFGGNFASLLPATTKVVNLTAVWAWVIMACWLE